MIIVDSNEPIEIVNTLKKYGVSVERSKLEISDYVFNDIIIERKDSRDFLQSIYDGRLFNQIKNMVDSEYKPMLVIHGSLPPRDSWIKVGNRSVRSSISEEEYKKRYQTTISVLSTIMGSFPKISVFVLKDRDQFIDLLVDLYYRQGKNSSKPVLKRRSSTISDYKWNLFSQLPGIGSNGCKILLDNNISVHQLAEMTPDEIKSKFKGVGENRAKLIHEILNT